MKKAHFILLKITLFLLTAIFFIGHNYAQAEEKPVAERLVSINLEDQDFTQALAAIADQVGITINIHGQMPQTKRDLFLKQVPLNQALAQVLRLYGVRNHAAAYNPEKKTVMLAILETSTMLAALPTDNDPKVVFEGDHEPLTIAQLQLLEPETMGDYFPLTIEQMDQLEPDDIGDQEPLTQEHMDQLEPDDIGDQESLTQEQMNQLEPDDIGDQEPLTQEQMDQLERDVF